jgi:hypothetical protein
MNNPEDVQIQVSKLFLIVNRLGTINLEYVHDVQSQLHEIMLAQLKLSISAIYLGDLVAAM